MISLLLFETILELFLILIMGFALVRLHVLESADSKSLSVLSLYLIAPCALISSFQITFTDEIGKQLLFSLCLGVVIHILLFVIVSILRRLLHLSNLEQASLIYSNSGNLIIPIITSVLGEEWVVFSCGYLVVSTILLWTHAKMLLCGERKADLKKILTNVNILAILIGGGLMLMRLKLPAILAGTIKSVSGMIGPISMIITGMIVGSIRPQQLRRYRRLWLIVALRLIVIPAIILLLLKYSGAQALVRDGQTIMLISLLAVMTPPASTITQMAQVYGQDAEYSSAINVVATISCIITMPLLVALYLH